MGIIPVARPALALDKLQKELVAKGVTEKVCVVGVRAAVGKNKRRVYDDQIYIVGPGVFLSFNANCDPNGVRPGRGKGSKKGIASLREGLYRSHVIGTHKRGTKTAHKALIQTAGAVVVLRDADASVAKELLVILDGIKCYLDGPGYFGINIHKGGMGSTSSLGCQTIPPSQWPLFISTIEKLLLQHKQAVVPYLLTRIS